MDVNRAGARFLCCVCMQRVADELAHSLSSLERLRDNFEYRDVQGKDQVGFLLVCNPSIQS